MADRVVDVCDSITVEWRVFGDVSVGVFGRLSLPCAITVTIVLVLLAPLLVAGPSVGVTIAGSNNVDVTTALTGGVIVDKDLGIVLPVDDLDSVAGRALPREMTGMLLMAPNAWAGVVPRFWHAIAGRTRAAGEVRRMASLQALLAESLARIHATYMAGL